eukprot:760002-Hanusia_phi.AAC.3
MPRQLFTMILENESTSLADKSGNGEWKKESVRCRKWLLYISLVPGYEEEPGVPPRLGTSSMLLLVTSNCSKVSTSTGEESGRSSEEK